ncbi:MAG: DoxX family membrane protein [Acidimicrobiaceae bacterium]|nr:DoxX family membrane protein [Acidimicrobiaceae bacterium]
MSASSSRAVRPSLPGERRPAFGAPVRAGALSEWALVPLRLFLGVTFVYAGLQKLANPNFFNPQSPSSIKAQLIASARVSPIHFLTAHLVGLATGIGIFIALAELAIGLGTLLGLWTRIAAIGGAVLSFSLFLTVSFHAAPFYTGADIVFTFAWLPFVISNSARRWSLDGLVARRVAREHHSALPDVVAIPFATVQGLCGHFSAGTCDARQGLACDAALCPVLKGPLAPIATRVELDSLNRRTVVLATIATVGVGTCALIAAGATAAAGRLIGGAPKPTNGTNQLLGQGPTTTTTPSSGTKTTGVLLGPAKDVPTGQAATFTIPSSGDPGIVLHPGAGQFLGYDAVCPHAGCQVSYFAASDLLVCPCHGSQFEASTGAVLAGPAPRGLTPLKIAEGSDGNLYLQ